MSKKQMKAENRDLPILGGASVFLTLAVIAFAGFSNGASDVAVVPSPTVVASVRAVALPAYASITPSDVIPRHNTQLMLTGDGSGGVMQVGFNDGPPASSIIQTSSLSEDAR